MLGYTKSDARSAQCIVGICMAKQLVGVAPLGKKSHFYQLNLQ